MREHNFSDAICPICGMRRADPKHRGKRAERCSRIRQARSLKEKAAAQVKA